LAEDSYVSVNPAGIGLSVLMGTVIGLLVLQPTAHGVALVAYVVIGLVHGGMAALASWVGFSAYSFFAEQRRERR